MKKYLFTMLALALTAFTFTGCEDVPMPYDMPSATSTGGSAAAAIATGSGTAADPFNAAGLNKYIEENLASGETSTTDLYVRGIVVSVKECSAQYGNATFYISDDGKNANTFYVYRCYGVGNKKISSDTAVEKGDEVVVCGKVTNYNGTYETVQNGAYLYSIKKTDGTSAGEDTPSTPAVEGEPKGTGTVTDPYNAVALNKYIADNLAAGQTSDTDIYVEGIIASVKECSAQYGNATFYISDDGKNANTFYVYRCYGLGNKKISSDTAVKEGDKVVVCGKVTNYNGTYETVQNGAYIYSINGKTEGGSETPATPSAGAEGDGTADHPFNVTAAINKCIETGTTSTTEEYYVQGIISSIKEVDTGSFGNATYYISVDGKHNNYVTVYRGYYLNGDKFTSKDQIAVGDKVVVKGTLVNYYGNTPELNQGNQIISIEKGEGGSTGGNTPGAPVASDGTVTFSTLGFANAEVLTTIAAGDATLSFDAGTNKNAPAYYNSGTAIRMYPTNSFTIAATKTIKDITFNCYNGNGVDYVAEGAVSSTAGKVTLSGLTFTISNVASKNVTITNTNANTGGASQLRIVSLTITYAE